MNPAVLDILDRLISFPTISRRPNLELLDYVEGLLKPAGIRVERFSYDDGSRANLWASVGPDRPGGVVLSGHSDVVPVEGQAWSFDPFTMRREDHRLYGRGAADMKGFLAAAIHAMLKGAEAPLREPLHLALSCDEEVGCLGVRPMIEALSRRPHRPAFCLVGEPTGMKIANGHKGKLALRACCHGREGHSALAPQALNALHLGAALILKLQDRQEEIAAHGLRDTAYDIPYTTIHAGLMQGGVQLNIVPNFCSVDFEIRNIAADDPVRLIECIEEDANAIAARYRNRFPEARIEIEPLWGYPGLETPESSDAVVLMRRLLGKSDPLVKVAFGTEGGLFQQEYGIPAIVCGPGHMAQGHKADEFVDEGQIVQCEALLQALTSELRAGAV